MMKKEYFDTKYYEVLENKGMIFVFKKTFWNKYLKFWKGFSKDCYVWEEDSIMTIITEKELMEEQ